MPLTILVHYREVLKNHNFTGYSRFELPRILKDSVIKQAVLLPTVTLDQQKSRKKY
jgi:hypothetical protein